MSATETMQETSLSQPRDSRDRMIQSLRERGADENTVRLCLGMSLLDRIIESNRGRKSHVFVTSFPKSGSTFLHRLALSATGYVDYLLDHFSEDQQQSVVLQWTPMFLAQNTVTQIHAFATAPNVRTLKQLWVKPVVLVRDLFDTLVSLRDHMVREDHIIPHAQVPAEFKLWSSEDQFWFIVRMITPWYLSFFASWRKSASELSVLWVKYERLVSDPAGTLQAVLEHSGVEIPSEGIANAIAQSDPARTRFNVGISGRGRQLLSQAQQQAVLQVAAAYRGAVDFSMIGIEDIAAE